MTEVEVTDLTHPLFGRRFAVRSISGPTQGPAHVFVAYRGHLTLRLPLLATNLTAPRPLHPTKLTYEAVSEFLAVAERDAALCPSDPPPSGRVSRPPRTSRSSTTSRRSSRR